MARDPVTWLSSDPHFRHRMVALLRGFPDSDAHDEAIIANWNALVHPQDFVWLLGDITLSSAKHAWPYVDRLNGVVHLVSGNHDAVHPMHRDSRRHQDEWRQHFASVQSLARIRLEGEQVLLSHHPYEGDHTPEDRDVQYRLRDCGKPIIHGHTHGRVQVNHTSLGTLQIHVGLDAHELKPVPMSWVMATLRGDAAIRELTLLGQEIGA